MIVPFREDISFAFECSRNLSFMYYGGADLGEMIITYDKIKAGVSKAGLRSGTSSVACHCHS